MDKIKAFFSRFATSAIAKDGKVDSFLSHLAQWFFTIVFCYVIIAILVAIVGFGNLLLFAIASLLLGTVTYILDKRING